MKTRPTQTTVTLPHKDYRLLVTLAGSHGISISKCAAKLLSEELTSAKYHDLQRVVERALKEVDDPEETKEVNDPEETEE